MGVTYSVENETPPKQEGIPIIEYVGDFSPIANPPITSLSTQFVVEKPSSNNTSFVGNYPPVGSMFN